MRPQTTPVKPPCSHPVDCADNISLAAPASLCNSRLMDLQTLVAKFGTQAQFARAVGCDRHYLNHVLRGRRPMGPDLAVRIYQATGHKLGPLAKPNKAAP